ncbi:MAG: FAD-binding oxidoreductase [Gammaproteobacteria bacterium]
MDRPAGAIPESDLQALRKLLGAGGFLDSPADRAPFETDFRGIHRGTTPLVALPTSTVQVAELVRLAAARRIPLVPQGGNTSYCGGATPRAGGGDVVVSLRRMNRIRALDAANESLTADAGCVLATLQQAAAAADRLLPMSLGSEGSCTLGGIVSTNAGGTAVLRYGMMRELVLGLEVVLPDGRVLDQLRGLRKDNTGYDVKQLFIGAEGTLGIVTAACLRLFPRPGATATAFIALPSPAAALALLARLRGALGDSVTTFELVPRIALELVCRHVPGCRDPFDRTHPWYALAEASLPQSDAGLAGRLEEALAAAIEAGDALDAATAASESQREAFWRLRETIPEGQRAEGPGLKHDVSVEPARLPSFIREGGALIERLAPGARLIAYGHLGDGNLHINVSAPAGGDPGPLLASGDAIQRAVHELVARYRGSFSAEHGIGQLKVGELARYEDPAALELMRRIKRAIDPPGIMNPGKVLEDPA